MATAMARFPDQVVGGSNTNSFGVKASISQYSPFQFVQDISIDTRMQQLSTTSVRDISRIPWFDEPAKITPSDDFSSRYFAHVEKGTAMSYFGALPAQSAWAPTEASWSPQASEVPSTSLAMWKKRNDARRNDSPASDRTTAAPESTSSEYEDTAPKGTQTTLMIHNIPVQYTQEMLMSEWPNHGDYDFLYLPLNNCSNRNLTYAFVNFTTAETARMFQNRWQNQYLKQFRGTSPLTITLADVQSREANLLKLVEKRTPKRRSKYPKSQRCQPMIFEGGNVITLDEALSLMHERSVSARCTF